MSDWKTYPQEVPDFNDEVVYYSHSFGMYYRGVYCDRGTTHEGTQAMLAGDLWKHGDTLPPPHSPESAETAPLAETAAATATGDDEITSEKLRVGEGWELYSSSMKYEYYETEQFGEDLYIRVKLSDGSLDVFICNRHIKITTMSELRTLIRWLS